MAASKSVVVIGAGVVGLSVAYYALREGHRVTVVERGGRDHDCCSLGNAGMVTPSHFIPLAAPGMVSLGLRMMMNPESPFWVRPRLSRDLVEWGIRFCQAATASRAEQSAPVLRDLLLASRASFEELSDALPGGFGLVQKGLLNLCKTEATLHEEGHVVEAAHKLGLEAELLDAAELARLEPNIRMDVAGAVYFPQDCHLTPARLMSQLLCAVEDGGADMRWNSEVIGWRASGSKIEAIQTSTGDITGDEYVLAAGAFSPQTVRNLGIRLPMQAGRGYNLTLPKPKSLPTKCAILTEGRVAVTPMGSSLRFAGTMEIVDTNEPMRQSRIDGILKTIPKYYPDFSAADFTGITPWSGMRPCSPDGLPYIGRFGRYSNLIAATGHAMLGVSLGPITGKLVTDLLSARKPSVSLDAVRPDRYA
jgi:D-amino-acid dehydrogenase